MTFLGLCSLSLSLSKRDYWKHFPCSSDLKRNWPPYSAAEREREQTTRSLCTPFLPKVSGEGVSAGSSPKPVQEKQPSDSPHAAGRRQERTENQAGLGFLQVSTSVRHNLFLRSLPIGSPTSQPGLENGHPRPKEEDGLGSGEALESLFLEIFRAEMRDSWTWRSPCSSWLTLFSSLKYCPNLSLPPSPTHFLTASSAPSRVQCSLRSEAVTSGASLTDSENAEAEGTLGSTTSRVCGHCCSRGGGRVLGAALPARRAPSCAAVPADPEALS